MDLFIDQKAKNALHKPNTDLKTVALNFQSHAPRLQNSRERNLPAMPVANVYSHARVPVRPPTGVY